MCVKGCVEDVLNVPLTHIHPASTTYLRLVHFARSPARPAALVAARI